MDLECTNCELLWPDTFSLTIFSTIVFTSVTSIFCLDLASFLSERIFTATAVHLLFIDIAAGSDVIQLRYFTLPDATRNFNVKCQNAQLN
jgi:hypothetical protein